MNIAGQLFSLRWNNYLGHMTGSFESMLTEEDFVDVTLSCEGKKIKAHKMLLSACSSYFKDLFKENPCQHPVIVFRNVRYDDLLALVNFIYQGEVSVEQEQLASFLSTAELLEVKGLTDSSRNNKEQESVPEEIIPPEVNTKSPRIDNSNKASEVSLTPINTNNDSIMQVNKKRRIDHSFSENNDTETHNRRRLDGKEIALNNSKQSVEIIPVGHKVKMEDNDSYYDEMSSYNVKLEPDNFAEFVMHSQKLDAGNLDDGSRNEPDISQPSSKSSVLGNEVSQDSIQGHWLSSLNANSKRSIPTTVATTATNQKHRYICNICGATYKHLRNLRAHCHLHYGKTRCNLCNKVLCNISYFKKHLQQQHGLLMDSKT